MALRSAHGIGKARALVRVEVPPADELGSGVPADASGPRASVERTADGRIASREAAAALGRAGARRRAELKAAQLRMLTSFGLVVEDVPAELVPYLDSAQEWCAAEAQRIALEVGGGVASPSVCALVQQAGLALAHSRHATSEGRHADSVRYGAEVRQNVLAAHHLAALEAKARPRAQTWNW